MTTTTLRFAALIAAAVAAGPCLAQTSEHATLTANSAQFVSGAKSALEQLAGLEDQLESPSLGSAANDEYVRLRKAIRLEPRIAEVDQVYPGTVYDVILQPGHYFRLQGATGTAGAEVSERALVNFITRTAADELRKRSLKVAVVSADTPFKDKAATREFDGLKGRIFLAIHADGATRPCSTGPSLAYKANSSIFAMHAVGWALSQALGYTYPEFMKDNFTANEANYYMFRHVDTPLMTGLLEVGELTCAKTEARLIGGAEIIGHNVARALEFVLKAAGASR